jgi:Peroxisome biogenesis factor 1, N-terminal
MDAASIEVEPLTTEDWELLEIHSEFLERGALLSQVSIVYPNQTLTLAVGAFDMVQVRILPFTNNPCCRLVANTEVIVIPKPRSLEPAPSTPLRVVPCWDDFSPRMQALAMREGILVPKVLPCSIMVHPETLQEHLPGWKGVQISKRTAPLAVLSTLRGEYSSVVQVTESYDVLKDHVGKYPACQWL